jgi:hypothetical protein
MEFENPFNTKQELAFICYCNPDEPRANCEFKNWDRVTFHSMINQQVRSSF